MLKAAGKPALRKLASPQERGTLDTLTFFEVVGRAGHRRAGQRETRG
jgi:hypothetical protein